MLTANVTALDTLIAPELLFTNYLGQLVTKDQDLALHRSGVLKFTALTPSEQQIQLYDTVAVVSVLMHLLGDYDGTAMDQHMRFTRVWAPSSTDQLQIVAGHASVVAS